MHGGAHGRGSSGTFAVVVIVASAGGLEAISRMLRDVPATLGVPIVVEQHLGAHGSQIVPILARRVPQEVAWAEEGVRPLPGAVTVCPPRRGMELLPDGTCRLKPQQAAHIDRPLDALLASAADSFGPATLAVVLTGMGRDAVAGAQAVRAGGGTVLVQDQETAEHASMPRGVVDADAADRVLPIHDLGRTIADLVEGRGLPPSRADVAATRWLFGGGGEVARAARQADWAATPLGPVSTWPAVLRTTLRLALEAPPAMCLLWGPEHVQLYNDAYRVIMGGKHPTGLGQPNRDCWPEVWHLNKGVYDQVLRGEAVEVREALYPIARHGALEDAWFDLSFSPVEDEHGAVGGILCVVVERTAEVLAARRLRTLKDLTDRAAGATTWRGAFEQLLAALEQHGDDVPYAVGYRVDDGGLEATLVGAVGVDPGDAAAPRVALGAGQPGWPFAAALSSETALPVDDVRVRFAGPDGAAGPGGDDALVVPLRHGGRDAASGAVVLGVPPRLQLDAAHQEFLRLVGGEIAVRLGEAHTREKERERIERLAELDRTKTQFFSNVSHEFRTPLTLMLAPLEELLADETLSERARADLDVVRRNAGRLLRLVGTLLDFSQVEAGRLRARFEPADLSALTTEITGVFHDAAARAGLTLAIDAPPLPQLVWLDPEMWEKILSNLLSNALKFTHVGGIEVAVRALPRHAEIQVRDTGVGIPRDEVPRVVQRFHRGRTTRGRTYEGVGIGLALVDELVRRHHGRLRIHSEVDVGTTVTVWLPFGSRADGHPPTERPERPERPTEQPTPTAAQLAEEAASWTTGATARTAPPAAVLDEPDGGAEHGRVPVTGARARVLVADDNHDLRDYLGRLLSPHFDVRTARDGIEALAAARRQAPDVVLSDVMMPGRDGLDLLKELRADDTLRTVPVVLLTARAGEDAAVDGLLAGADDYIVKPFSGRELVARLGAQIELARVRRQGENRFRALINASWDAVYRMSADWSEMHALNGRGFIADTSEPSSSWLERYIPAEDREQVGAAIRRAVETRTMFELEHRVHRPDGTMGWTLSRAVPLCDDQGRILEWVGAARDLTGRHG